MRAFLAGPTMRSFESGRKSLSNGDGIDVRLWRDEGDGPPTVLVPCKRQQAKIDKMVVKSLFADVTHHRAGSGLIVTTSSFSKGALDMKTKDVEGHAERSSRLRHLPPGRHAWPCACARRA
jgi:Restriction endonuclease